MKRKLQRGLKPEQAKALLQDLERTLTAVEVQASKDERRTDQHRYIQADEFEALLMLKGKEITQHDLNGAHTGPNPYEHECTYRGYRLETVTRQRVNWEKYLRS